MKRNTKKIIALTTLAISSIGLIFAQDDSAEVTSFASTDDAEAASSVNVAGEASVNVRSYVDKDDVTVDEFSDLQNLPIDSNPEAKLNVEYSSGNADANIKLNFNSNVIKNHPEDVIDELTLRGYFGNFNVEAGKMKVVWGKGDKLHVIDNFNADDYTDFIIPDYLDRRISTPMLRGVYNFGVGNLQLEAVYTPFLPTDRFATSGNWTPAAYSSLYNTVYNVEEAKVAKTFSSYTNATALASEISTLKTLAYGSNGSYTDLNALQKLQTIMTMYGFTSEDDVTSYVAKCGTEYMSALTEASSYSANILYPDTNSLKYSQAGARLTGTVGSFDYGLSYYYGHYKQPTVDWTNYLASYVANSGVSYANPSLKYDTKQTLGVEAATVLWHFNLRGEAAYNLTEDTDGTDPYTHNNSVQWVGGFDIDIPLNNMNINVQETGTYILNNDKITDSNAFDADYNANGKYTNNKLVFNVSDSWMNDKIVPEVSVLWGIENNDVLVMPKLTYKQSDGLSFALSGMYIWCKDDNSEFASWKDNSFVNFAVKCQF